MIRSGRVFRFPKLFDFSPYEGKELEYVRHFLGLLIWKTEQRKVDSQGFVHLKSAYLPYPKRVWQSMRKKLLESGAVISNNLAFPGLATGYRLDEKLWRGGFITEPCNDHSVIRRLESFANRRFPEPIQRELKLKYDELDVSVEVATPIAAKLKRPRVKKSSRRHIAYLKTKGRHEEAARLERGFTPDQYRRDLLTTIENMNKGEWFYEVADNGRIFNPITATKRELRKCFSVAGKPLWQVDIPNAQPLFFVLFFYHWLNLSPRQKSEYLKRTFDGTYSPKIWEAIARTWKEKPPDPLKHADILAWLKSCIKVRWYEELMGDDINKRDPEKDRKLTDEQVRKRNRRKFKDRTYPTLNGPPGGRKNCEGAVRALIKQKYPLCIEILNELKSGPNKHNQCSLLYHHLEATLVIGIVSTRILKDSPDIPLFTLHDSLLTTKENIQLVATIMEEELLKICGLLSNLKLKKEEV